MKDTDTARLDVLEAAVLALARALPAVTASAVCTHLAQRVALMQHPSPEADAAAAATLARLLGALSSQESSHRWCFPNAVPNVKPAQGLERTTG